jgi:hypothetical protein
MEKTAARQGKTAEHGQSEYYAGNFQGNFEKVTIQLV